MFLKIFMFIFTSAFLIFSCTPNSDFEKQLKTAIAEKKGDDLLNELSILDRKFTNKLELKIHIGAMLIAKGEINKAALFLKKGEELILSNRNKPIQAELFAKLSELAYIQGNFTQGISYADKSLDLDSEDPLGVTFTKAKCLYFAGQKEKSLSLFKAVWDKKKKMMDKDDMNFYLSLLRDNNEYDRALAVSEEFGLRFDYQIGLGIIESVFYEKLGMINESIISAAKDLEYSRFTGSLKYQEELDRLTQLNNKIAEKTLPSDRKGIETINGLIFYISGKWDKANEALLGVDLKEKELPFYTFLVKSSLLEIGKADEKDLSEYKNLEKYFRSFPNYYYHLFRGILKTQKNPETSEIRNAIETCIILAPATEYAKEARIELAKLIGLKPTDGEKLLIGPELDRFYLRLEAGQPAEILLPVMNLLNLPDNIYTLAAVFMLKKAKRFVTVKDFLNDRRKTASGSLKERLETIMTD